MGGKFAPEQKPESTFEPPRKTVRPPTHEEQVALSAVKISLVDDHPYLSPIVYGVVPVVVEGLGTFAVDDKGRLYFDPECFEKWSPQEVKGVLFHEACHLLFEHPVRFAGFVGVPPDEEKQKLVNVAGDLAINDMLVANGVQLPDGVLLPQSLSLPSGLTAEEYLSLLVRRSDRDGREGQQDGREGQQDGREGQRGRRRGRTQTRAQPGDNGTPHQHQHGTPCCGSGSGGRPGEWEEQADRAGITSFDHADMENMARRAADEYTRHINQGGKQMGNGFGNQLRKPQPDQKPTIHQWRQEMRAALSDTLGRRLGLRGEKRSAPTPYPRRSTFAVLSKARKQYQTGKRVTPPLIEVEKMARNPQIDVVIDTSGSMSDRDLGAVLAELQGMIRQLGFSSRDLRISTGDSGAATTPQRVSKLTDVKMVGGGGTDMGKVLEELSSDRRAGGRGDIAVIVTDGHTPWPSPGLVKERYNGRVVAVIVGDDADRVHVPDHIIPIRARPTPKE